MPRPLLEPLSGSELKNGHMTVLELKMIRGVLGAEEHRRLRMPGEPRPISQDRLGKRLDPPVTGRTVRNWLTGATKIPVWHIRRLREMKRRALAALRAERASTPRPGESQ